MASNGIDGMTQEENLRLTLRVLVLWAALSFTLLLGYSAGAFVTTPTRQGFTKFLVVSSDGALLAVAFSALGALFGFLFGIPRTQQQEPLPAGGAASGATSGAYKQAVNTNLEQVSDWLTKILIGVGLAELAKIPQKLVQLAEYFKSGFDGNATLALVLILNFLVYGFFAGYLLTRLFLAGAFSEADQASAKIGNLVQVAGMLTNTKGYGVAAATLESALAELRPDTPKETKRRVFEELTYNYLYEDPPVGFQKALQYGRRYIDEEPKTPSPRIWTNLAAAYGQQYKWELEHEKRQDVLDETKKNALNAAKEALRLEPKMKNLLRMLWDPNDVTKVSKEEDDLEVFYNDPDFRKILGE